MRLSYLIPLALLAVFYSESVAAADLDLNRYCQDKGFERATVNGTIWGCVGGERHRSIDFAEACKMQHGNDFRPYLENGQWKCGQGVGMRDLPPPRQ